MGFLAMATSSGRLLLFWLLSCCDCTFTDATYATNTAGSTNSAGDAAGATDTACATDAVISAIGLCG